MNPEEFLKEFGHLVGTQGGLRQLRSLLRLLAVTGRLSEREPGDESLERTLADAESLKPQEGTRGRSRGSGSEPGTVRPSVPLPSHWAWTKFVDVAVIQSNLVPPSKYFSHPHVAPDNIEKETGRLLDYRSIGEDGVRSNKHLFYPGQILYSKIRPNLSKAVAVDFEGLCSADMYPLLPLIDRRYLLLFILSEPFLKQVVVNDNRVAMPKVNQEQLSEAWVAVPPLPEQKRIAEKVDQLMTLCDELEAKQKQKREKAVAFNKAALSAVVHAPGKSQLKGAWSRVQDHFEVLYELPENVKELRQTILQLAVMGKLVRQDPKDEDVDTLLTRVERERREAIAGRRRGGRGSGTSCEAVFERSIPKSWRKCSLGDLADHIVDGTHHTPKYVDKGMDFISAKDIRRGEISFEGCRQISKDEYDALTLRCAPKRGNVLITKSGSIGEVAIVEVDRPFTLFESVALVPVLPSMNARYVALVMQLEGGGKFAQEKRRGVGVPHLHLVDLRTMPVPVPPLAEQERIVTKVRRLMDLCGDLEAKLGQHRGQGQRLMQAVVEGLVG